MLELSYHFSGHFLLFPLSRLAKSDQFAAMRLVPLWLGCCSCSSDSISNPSKSDSILFEVTIVPLAPKQHKMKSPKIEKGTGLRTLPAHDLTTLFKPEQEIAHLLAEVGNWWSFLNRARTWFEDTGGDE